MAATEQKVIATAGLISVGIGSANSIVKYKQPPSTKFLIGSGIAFLIFSAMAETESLGEVAKGLALGIMSTIILGEGGGVMTYFVGKNEVDTRKPPRQNVPTPTQTAPRQAPHLVGHLNVQVQPFRPDQVQIQPFQPSH